MVSSKSDHLVQQAESNRKELQALGLQNRIYEEKINLHVPNICQRWR